MHLVSETVDLSLVNSVSRKQRFKLFKRKRVKDSLWLTGRSKPSLVKLVDRNRGGAWEFVQPSHPDFFRLYNVHHGASMSPIRHPRMMLSNNASQMLYAPHSPPH